MIGVRPWAVAVGLSCIAAAGLAGALVAWSTIPPPPPGPCHDSAVLDYGSWEHRCHPEAEVQVYPAGLTSAGSDRQLIKCVCRRGAKR